MIYDELFSDKNFIHQHDKGGFLSMTNIDSNTNGSQYFITTIPTLSFNGKYVQDISEITYQKFFLGYATYIVDQREKSLENKKT